MNLKLLVLLIFTIQVCMIKFFEMPKGDILLEKSNHYITKDIMTSDYVESMQYEEFTKIDTVELRKFWKQFQTDLKASNKERIKYSLSFPIYAYNMVQFQYSYDCDTTAFIKNEKKYDVKVDHTNINHYYEFIFQAKLKNILEQITFQKLLANDMNKSDSEIDYVIFAKDFIAVPCYNDISLLLRIVKNDNRWKISFGYQPT